MVSLNPVISVIEKIYHQYRAAVQITNRIAVKIESEVIVFSYSFYSVGRNQCYNREQK
jgi:hypothetical protein